MSAPEKIISAPPDPGRLHSKWWQTKKITEWEYDSVVPLDPKMVERFGKPVVHVNLVRGNRGDDKETYHFTARCDWFGDKQADREISAKDLGTLEDKAKRILDDCVLAQSGIVWSDWIEIRVAYGLTQDEERVTRRMNRREEREVEFKISYKILKRARLPDGRDMVLEGGWSMKPFPKPKRAGKKSSARYGDDDYDSRNEEDEYTYIPATPEALASLDSISARVVDLGKRVQVVLGQANVMAALADVSKALPQLEHKR